MTGGSERERITPRHPVNAGVLTFYNVKRSVNSTCGRCAVVCEKTKQWHLKLSWCNSTHKLQCWGVNSKSGGRLLHVKPSQWQLPVQNYWMLPEYLQPLTLRWYNCDGEHVRRPFTTIVVTRHLVIVTLLTHFIVVMMWRDSTRDGWLRGEVNL
jgi:hypothetical protein